MYHVFRVTPEQRLFGKQNDINSYLLTPKEQ